MSPPLERRAACPRCQTVVTLRGEAIGERRLECEACGEVAEVGVEDWRDPPPVAGTGLVKYRADHRVVGGRRLLGEAVTTIVVRRRGRKGLVANVLVGTWLAGLLVIFWGLPIVPTLGAGLGIVLAWAVARHQWAQRVDVDARGVTIRRGFRLERVPATPRIPANARCLVLAVRSRPGPLAVEEHIVRIQAEGVRVDVGRGMRLGADEAEALADRLRRAIDGEA